LMAADRTFESTIVRPGALPGLASAQEPAWSPDGSRLAFSCQFGEGSSALVEICVVNADGTQPIRLTTDAWRDGSPDWSPDGTTIALQSNRSDVSDRSDVRITFMNPQGGDVSLFIEGHAPAWSGDGTRILFHRISPAGGLYSVRRDGTQLSRLTTATDHDVTWRP
jgi:Tol biopolymer transport system component